MTDTQTLPFGIESAGMDDLPDVMQVMASAFDPEYGEAWTEPQCAGILGMPGTWMVIARKGRTPVGFALARAIADDGELLLLAVDSNHQRTGIGQALLSRIIEDAADAGVSVLHLEVRACNSAVQLYKQSGFEQVGIRKGYYRGRFDKIFDALTFNYILRCNESSN